VSEVCEHGGDWDEMTCAWAAMLGNYMCLKYLHEQGCQWSSLTCTWAAVGNHLGCLMYAHQQGCKFENFDMASGAAGSGSLSCLKYAIENGCKRSFWICREAAWKGHLGCLKCAREMGCEWDRNMPSISPECVQYIIEQNIVDINYVKFVHVEFFEHFIIGKRFIIVLLFNTDSLFYFDSRWDFAC
jgi:hypothetical protein